MSKAKPAAAVEPPLFESPTEATARAVLATRGVVTVDWVWQRTLVWGRLQPAPPSPKDLAREYLAELQLELLGGE